MNVAVLLSSFNGENFIKEQIDSILSQTIDGRNLHLFIRDDGSTDSTLNILNNIASCDTRVSVFSGNNIGYVKSFFYLLKMIKSKVGVFEYISLADQDDVWDEDKLQVAIDILESERNDNPKLYQSTSRVVSKCLEFRKTTQRKRREINFYNTIIQTFAAGHTYVFNSALLKLIDDNLDYSNIYAHDSYLNNLAVLSGEIYFDNNPHVNYRQHNKNLLGNEEYGLFSWIALKIQRLRDGDNIKYAKQILYISKSLVRFQNQEQIYEIDKFFGNQKNIVKRIRYAFSTKLYRQGRLEDFAFKFLYICGGFNIDKRSVHS